MVAGLSDYNRIDLDCAADGALFIGDFCALTFLRKRYGYTLPCMLSRLKNLCSEKNAAMASPLAVAGLCAGCSFLDHIIFRRVVAVCFGNFDKLGCITILTLIGFILRRGAGCIGVFTRCLISVRNNRDFICLFCHGTADCTGVYL